MGGCRVLVLLGLGLGVLVEKTVVGESETVKAKVKVWKQVSSTSQVSWTERTSSVRLALNPDLTPNQHQLPPSRPS